MTTDSDLSPTPDHVHGDRPPVARFELVADEGAGDGLRRIAIEQISLASWHMQRVGEGLGHVHEFRKATKRMRAVLRMVCYQIGEDRYRALNAAVRDMARELSELRTAIVRLEMLEALVVGDASLGSSSDGLSDSLAVDVARRHDAVVGDTRLIDDMNDRLAFVGGAVEEWSISENFDPTSMGLQRTYRRGRRGMARAYGEGTAERFHRWRKEVKYLRHQIEVLGGAVAESAPTLISTLEELGDGLGVDHDLADLEQAISSMVDEQPASRIDNSGLVTAIGRRRWTLHDDLVPLGESVYAREPYEFQHEMAIYWRRWKAPIH